MNALDRRMMLVAGLGSAAAVSLVAGRAEAEHYPPTPANRCPKQQAMSDGST
jgi:hypothetical protein